MMIKFVKNNNILILEYLPDDEPTWLNDKFRNNEGVCFDKTFHLTKHNLVKKFKTSEYLDYKFKFGVLEKGYYKINKEILGITNNLYIYKDIKLEKKYFVTNYTISIFKHIDNLISESFFLGGANKSSISHEGFKDLLKQFPNTTEKKKYCELRLSVILTKYFESTRVDVKDKYEKYMNKKKSVQGFNLLDNFRNYEKDKYSVILKKLKNMLSKEDHYNEKQWQEEIIEILLLIFPKYIKVFQKVKIKDSYTENKKRELDYLLVDSEGYIDILEIKRPLDHQIVPDNPNYRGNYCPVKELSGTVMQVEKYILHLNKWGKRGEDYLNKKYNNNLPNNCQIKITNPGAMIVLGRSNNLNLEQKEDFEIIKRKYKNIIDIITYDDLIQRLQCTVSQYEYR